MVPLVTAVMFVGYTLVYAAVANGGKLASRPWEALREDAYTGATTGGAHGGGGKSTWDRIIGAGGWLFHSPLDPIMHLPGAGLLP